jgi:hypothetical protein
MTKFIVDGRPFICVAGELTNSASSDIDAVNTDFSRLAKAHLNTVLSVVSWDLVEPRENQFDFSMIDYQIAAARANNVRLVMLWMASWKNSLSHYPPPWVKADQARFPRVVNAKGNTLEILSTVSDNNRNADAKAFAAVMKHIRQVDTAHTVIAVQVENESGVLGSPRDHSPAAEAAFKQPVPTELIQYLQDHKNTLRPEMKKIWDAAGDKTSGTWEEVFGKNIENPDPPASNDSSRSLRPADFDLYNHTDEIFMAWNYSRYINAVAAAGKQEYPIPMYVNTWLVQPRDRGPGDYPSGGAEPLVHDIWRAGGHGIDILAPDIYLPDYAAIIDDYARNGNPAWNLLCFSPFGIDNLNPDSNFAKAYGFIDSISGAIAEAQGKPNAIKLITLQPGENPGKVEMGNYVFDFTPPPASGGRGRGARAGAGAGAGGAAPAADDASPPAPAANDAGRLAFLDAPFVLIINTGPDEYYFATNGNFPFIVSPKAPGDMTAAPATIDKGHFKNGAWVLSHRYNGDDIMGRGYDISGAAANHLSGSQVPLGNSHGRGAAAPTDGAAAPVVFRVTFYQYR